MSSMAVRLLLVAAATASTAAGATALYRGAAPPSTAERSAEPVPDASLAPQFRSILPGDIPHNFYFSRAAYGANGFRSSWTVDYPTADRWIANVLARLTGIDVYPFENPIALDDPNLRRFPFIYAVEVGSMGLSPDEVEGLRNYLLAGGFLFADDFWGSREWANFEYEIRQVLPEYEIVEIPRDHAVFSSFYVIDEILQVPNVGQGRAGGPTWEADGYTPYCLGIFDEKGRLMVVINWNTDLGDAWEWAEDPWYPLPYSTYAYQMAANFIVYAMTH